MQNSCNHFHDLLLEFSHYNSDKINELLGFKPKYTIEDAVKGLCNNFKNEKIKDSFNDDFYFNVKRLKRLQVK